MKNVYKPSVFNVGFMGEGRFRSHDNGKMTPAYQLWSSILRRCYSEEYLKRRPNNEECYVADEWHNFQNFAEWFEKEKNANTEGFVLDKDLRDLSKKCYSKDTCSFVPNKVNTIIADKKRKNSNLPTGIMMQGVKFRACIRIDGVNKNIGSFVKLSDAVNAYKKAKKERIVHVANFYKDCLHPEVYLNLINYNI